MKHEDLHKLDLEALIRRTFELAQSARKKGNHPFGALLADLDGNIVLEVENNVVDTNDATHHAERNLMSAAARKFSPEELSRLVMFTSTEPCAMCAGAVFWVGVRAVVYGLREVELVQMCTTESSPYPMVLNLPCEKVFETAPHHPTLAIGPILEDEARAPHEGFWVSGY